MHRQLGSKDPLKSIEGVGVELREKSGGQKGDTRLLWQIRQRRIQKDSTNAQRAKE